MLYEAWVNGPDSGEHWEGDPQSGGKSLANPPWDVPDKHYYPPNINVMDRSASEPEARSKSTRLFYDFYALALLKDMVGTPRYPVKNQMGVLSQFARGIPGSNVFMVNHPEVNIRMMGGEVTEKLRNIVDEGFEVVTKAITRKLLHHLRLTLIQEFRYIIGHSPDWQKFRQHLVSLYNKNQSKISKQEFLAAIQSKIPGMVEHPDAVKRIMLFSKYYSPMSGYDGSDPATALDDRPAKKKNEPEPEIGSPTEPEEPEPEEPQNVEPEEPDDTDYSAPETDIPPGADYDTNPSDFMDKYGNEIEKAKLQQWFAAKKKKLNEDTYAGGRISPSTVKKIFAAIHKSGLTWNDVILGYEKLDWGAGVGAGLDPTDKNHPGFGGARWGVGVEEFLKLVAVAKSDDTIKMAELVDHIYDLQHNSGNLLNKGGMWVADADLDRRSIIASLPRFLPNVSPFVKRLILRVLPAVTKHPAEERDIDAFTASPTQPLTPEEEAEMTKMQFAKSPSGGNAWVTQSPFKNKKGHLIQRHFIFKHHTNGLYSLADSMNAEGRVFDDFAEAKEYLVHKTHDFVMPQVGSDVYKMAADTEKENYLNAHTKIKLDAAKETQLLDVCKMAWRPSNSYYKAHLPKSERFQFFAFNDGTFIGCLKNKGGIEFTAKTWDEAFEKCKQITANALPSEEYEEGKAWIGKPLGSPAPVVTPQQTQTPSVGSVPATEFTLSPIENQTLQILASQVGGVTVETNVMPEGVTAFKINLDTGMQFNVLTVGKKALSPTGKKYVIKHSVAGGTTEDWSFANWNNALTFIKNNFSMLTQAASEVKGSVSMGVTPQVFATQTTAPLPPPANSKAVYKAHLGVNKPPAHTIRLTTEDEQMMTGLGFEPKMVGSDVWYIHKTIGDTVKFFPNDIAKILFVKTNNSIIVTKKIDEALAWLQSTYAGATKSPIVAAPQASTKGSKAGAMYEKYLTDKGFVWEPNAGQYVNQNNSDIVLIFPFPKSIFSDAETGQQQKFGSLPALANFLKGYDGLKKKY